MMRRSMALGLGIAVRCLLAVVFSVGVFGLATAATASEGAFDVAVATGPAPAPDAPTVPEPQTHVRDYGAAPEPSGVRPEKSPRAPVQPATPGVSDPWSARADGPEAPTPPPADDSGASSISERLDPPPTRTGGKIPCTEGHGGCGAGSSTGKAPEPTSVRAPHTMRPLHPLHEGAAWTAASLATGAGLLALALWRLGRLGALAVKLRGLVPLGWRIDEAALRRHPARRRMLEALAREPGATSRSLATAAGVGYNRAIYHLEMLQRGGLVRVHRQGRCKRYVLADAPRLDQDALRTRDLTDPTSRPGQILALLQYVPGLSLSMVARRLGLSPGHAHYHLSRLSEAGLVERVRRGRRVRHYLTDVGHAAAPIAPAAPVASSDGVAA